MTKKWLETRRSYLDKLKSQVELMSGPEDPSITEYSFSNKALYKKVWSNSDEESFMNEVSKSSLVLCGDFHSSPSVKRFYIRFFEAMTKKTDRPLCLALECFDFDQQENLELWLRGSLSDTLFLERSKWSVNWGFNWECYRQMLRDLDAMGVRLKCVNHQDQDFNFRDQKIAENLNEILNDQTDNQILFCMIGQHHLGPDNLVAQIKKIREDINCLCLHLDPEDLYFDIGHLTLLEDTIVLNNDNHFAYFSSPPWVHWQNHLMFLEEYLDVSEEEHDYHSDLSRTKDYDLVVFDYVKLLCKDLNINPKTLKRVEVSSIDEYQVQGDFNDEQLYKTLEPFLDSETSFYWPEQQEGIMVVSSLNHAATVAGRSLHAQMMGIESLPWGDVDSFKVWSWLEAVGYFLSKFINPRRTPVATQNLGAFLKARLGEESSKKIMTFLVRSRVEEIKGESQSLKNEVMEWNELIYAARLKGSLVGECLFELYLDGQFEAETIKTYMSLPVTDKSYFEPLYDFVVGRLNLSLNP
jgi:hypothetical protein